MVSDAKAREVHLLECDIIFIFIYIYIKKAKNIFNQKYFN